ncbi:MAG: hypothetical protein JF606_21830 [Burkholderiales bacterium]|nr:hypothetical protein [Burkholderiales bacterium]
MSADIKNIRDLPTLDIVKKRARGLALLDASIMPEWEHRYFSFNCKWEESGSEMMASMRDGAGSEYFLLFSEGGAVGKVFDSDAEDNAAALIDVVPDAFLSFKNEPAFSLTNATFFFWQEAGGKEWVATPDDLPTYANLRFLAEGAPIYHRWAERYYERQINVETMNEVFTSLTVTAQQLSRLNLELTIDDLTDDLIEILGEAP